MPKQNVSSIQGLEVAAPYLRQWCSSLNDEISSLDFSNFIQLDTIECYESTALVNVNLANTPALQRACFENCNLDNLDLSQSPNLRDLRSALNAFTTINFSTVGTDVWHICIRDNPQLTNRYLFNNTTQFSNIKELWIWNTHQTGALNVLSSSQYSGVSILANNNQYTSANFNGAFQNSSLEGKIDLSYNQLTSVIITGCAQLTNLNLQNNSLNQTMVDSILFTLDSLGRSNGHVNLLNNVAPSSSGMQYVQNLMDKGWQVDKDE